MIRLNKSVHAWGTPNFEAILKQEVSLLNRDQLPLQQGLSTGNYVIAAPITVMIHNVTDMQDVIRVRAGIFYHSVIAGCSCANDPTSASENIEHCEVQLDIDKATAATAVMLIS